MLKITLTNPNTQATETYDVVKEFTERCSTPYQVKREMNSTKKSSQLMNRNSPRNRVRNRTKRKRFPRMNRKPPSRRRCKNAHGFKSID